jgi:3-phosphoshikimate 1-carboxyvinyltransferase
LNHLHLHHTSAPFHAQLRLPGDKSISHRAAILAAIAEGTSTISGFLESEDCLATIAVLQKLGITIEHPKQTIMEPSTNHETNP